MNKSIFESIEWHKDQLFKLLDSDDFIKIESDIHSVKADLNEIVEKAKSKKRVWVKPTASKKGYYREQEVGRKDEEKKLSSKEKHSIYTTAYEEGAGDRESDDDRRQYDKSLTDPKNEKESQRADGYADGWEEKEDKWGQGEFD